MEKIEKISLALKIRDLGIFTSLYKLIIYLYIGIREKKDLRFLLGSGSFYNAVMKAVRKGFIVLENDSLVLTKEGERIARILYSAVSQILGEREGERERN